MEVLYIYIYLYRYICLFILLFEIEVPLVCLKFESTWLLEPPSQPGEVVPIR